MSYRATSIEFSASPLKMDRILVRCLNCLRKRSLGYAVYSSYTSFPDVTILQNDTILAEQVINMTNNGYDVEDDFMYFKAVVYHVNHSADSDEFAQITIYELKNSHEGYAFSE